MKDIVVLMIPWAAINIKLDAMEITPIMLRSVIHNVYFLDVFYWCFYAAISIVCFVIKGE